MTKGIRSTGCFRLPGVLYNSDKIGIGANSEKRVITFLPPPLQAGSKRDSGRSTTEFGAVDEPSSPTLGPLDYDIHVSVDTDTIARRYSRTETLKQKVRVIGFDATGRAHQALISSDIEIFSPPWTCLESRVVDVSFLIRIIRLMTNRRLWSGTRELLLLLR